MANLKDLKNRISSVKSTQKITKAMKMVAASKLRRAQERAEASRPYSEKMERVLAALAGNIDVDNAPSLLSGHRNEAGELVSNVHLVIVATADRGLCGGFNSSIVKSVKLHVADLVKQGKQVRILTIGKKGQEVLKLGYEDYMIEHVDTSARKQPHYDDAETLTNIAIDLFNKAEIDSCSIVFNRFISPLQQDVTFQQLIPLDISSLDVGAEEVAGVNAVYEYEPSEEAILSDLLPRNIAVQIYAGLLENAASEQGARMTAMDNATRNAGDMIDRLTLVYNRTRQAAITTELTEIISGAEAL